MPRKKKGSDDESDRSEFDFTQVHELSFRFKPCGFPCLLAEISEEVT